MRVLALLLALVGGVAQAQTQMPAPQVSLLTFSPGDIYWQRFGHNALVVRDGMRAPQLYNYGVFDFRQKNFFLNFARGQMVYRLDVSSLAETLYAYAREGRWAYEQVLNLSPQQAQKLADFLLWNARPENAEYRYEYFTENCSTRVRDALDAALDGALRRELEAQPAGRSLRYEATRLISPHPALMLGMDAGMGPRADASLNVWQQSFVPMTLMQALGRMRLRDAQGVERPLVAQERWLLQAARAEPPAGPPSFLGSFAVTGALLAVLLGALLAAARSPGIRRAGAALASGIALLTGLCGVILLLGWTLTDHWVMQANGNLLLLNPLYLLLLPACWRLGSAVPVQRYARGIAILVTAGACVAPVLALGTGQQQAQWLALLLPVNLVLGWQLLRRRRAD